MSACEWCWAQASKRAGLTGGSVVEHYREVLLEQEQLAREGSPDCPNVVVPPPAREALR